MIKSIKRYMIMPIQILPFVNYNGTGDKTLGKPIDVRGYVAGKITVVRNSSGNEVISQLQVYLNGNIEIRESDEIIFNAKQYQIKAIGPFYNNKGILTLQVVYV